AGRAASGVSAGKIVSGAITLDELVLVSPRSSTCSSTGTLGALAQTKPHEQERGPQAPFLLLTSPRHHSGRRLISTRRFCARPSGVLLLAIGWLGPTPRLLMRAPDTPWLVR